MEDAERLCEQSFNHSQRNYESDGSKGYQQESITFGEASNYEPDLHGTALSSEPSLPDGVDLYNKRSRFRAHFSRTPDPRHEQVRTHVRELTHGPKDDSPDWFKSRKASTTSLGDDASPTTNMNDTVDEVPQNAQVYTFWSDLRQEGNNSDCELGE